MRAKDPETNKWKDIIPVSQKLREARKTNEEFEFMLSNITIEELIALKLEIASRMYNGKFYGIPIWKTMPDIVKAALLKYVMSVCTTWRQACAVLGTTQKEFYTCMREYGIYEYFSIKTLQQIKKESGLREALRWHYLNTLKAKNKKEALKMAKKQVLVIRRGRKQREWEKANQQQPTPKS